MTDPDYSYQPPAADYNVNKYYDNVEVTSTTDVSSTNDPGSKIGTESETEDFYSHVTSNATNSTGNDYNSNVSKRTTSNITMTVNESRSLTSKFNRLNHHINKERVMLEPIQSPSKDQDQQSQILMSPGLNQKASDSISKKNQSLSQSKASKSASQSKDPISLSPSKNQKLLSNISNSVGNSAAKTSNANSNSVKKFSQSPSKKTVRILSENETQQVQGCNTGNSSADSRLTNYRTVESNDQYGNSTNLSTLNDHSLNQISESRSLNSMSYKEPGTINTSHKFNMNKTSNVKEDQQQDFFEDEDGDDTLQGSPKKKLTFDLNNDNDQEFIQQYSAKDDSFSENYQNLNSKHKAIKDDHNEEVEEDSEEFEDDFHQEVEVTSKSISSEGKSSSSTSKTKKSESSSSQSGKSKTTTNTLESHSENLASDLTAPPPLMTLPPKSESATSVVSVKNPTSKKQSSKKTPSGSSNSKSKSSKSSKTKGSDSKSKDKESKKSKRTTSSMSIPEDSSYQENPNQSISEAEAINNSVTAVNESKVGLGLPPISTNGPAGLKLPSILQSAVNGSLLNQKKSKNHSTRRSSLPGNLNNMDSNSNTNKFNYFQQSNRTDHFMHTNKFTSPAPSINAKYSSYSYDLGFSNDSSQNNQDYMPLGQYSSKPMGYSLLSNQQGQQLGNMNNSKYSPSDTFLGGGSSMNHNVSVESMGPAPGLNSNLNHNTSVNSVISNSGNKKSSYQNSSSKSHTKAGSNSKNHRRASTGSISQQQSIDFKINSNDLDQSQTDDINTPNNGTSIEEPKYIAGGSIGGANVNTVDAIKFRSSLSAYPDGVLETEFLQRVIQNDEHWVVQCLSCFGKSILFSDWAGGLCRTSILYAAKTGKTEMCKILLAYGGTELLSVKDVKSRDAQYYANAHGLDLKKVMRFGLRIDCWNFSVLNELEKFLKIPKNKKSSSGGSGNAGSDYIPPAHHLVGKIEPVQKGSHKKEKDSKDLLIDSEVPGSKSLEKIKE